MDAPQPSPFTKGLPIHPEMRCASFQGKASLMRLSGWEAESMADAQQQALAFINVNHGIEIVIIETTLAQSHAVVTIWYRSPFHASKGEPPEPGESPTEN